MSWKKANSFAAAGGTELDSLPSGSIAYLSTVFDNSAALDTVLFLSFNLASVAPSASSPTLGVYMLPLNADNATYGDQPASALGTQQTTPPSFDYYFGPMTVPSSTTAGVQNGTREMPKDLPPGKYAIGISNNLGSALGPSGNTIQYATNSWV